MNDRVKKFSFLVGILIIAIGLKFLLLFYNTLPFNSDEAIVALMARHILNGERPVFFYGQAYMGSLDAWLVALGFVIFGQKVWVIRLVQTLLYLFTIITTVWIGKKFLGSFKLGLSAGLLLAIPTVNVTLYTTASLGGYGEALLIGNLILITGLNIIQSMDTRRECRNRLIGWWLGLGLLAGVGLWANGLTLIYTIPVSLFIIYRLIRIKVSIGDIRDIMFGVAGFLIGSMAWWWFAATNGINALIHELLGSAVAVEGGNWLIRTGQHIINLLLLGSTVTFGLRPPWGVTWLGLPLIPVVLLIWAFVFVQWSRLIFKNKEKSVLVYGLLAGVCLTLVAGFIFTSFGVDPSGRYFVPLVVPFSLAASAAILHRKNRKYLIVAGLSVLIVFNLWGTVQSALKNPPGITTQFYAPAQVDHSRMDELISFLMANDLARGYTNYWVSYPLAFLSNEEIIYTPRLPYHTDLRYTSRDDRIISYQALVDTSDEVAYITSKNPNLDNLISSSFSNAGISWEEKWVGDYHIFYNLSQPIRPTELGIDNTGS